jgi:predicted acylesterase/phospholipase RssA
MEMAKPREKSQIPKLMRFKVAVKLKLFMPISGAKIANQFAIIKHLLKCRYMPDIIGGTSGGCIVAVTLIALRVSEVRCERSYLAFCEKLDYILNNLDSSWYARPQSFCQMFSTFKSFKTGYLYDKGRGEEYIKDYALDITGQPETWLGTFDRTAGHHQLWCTKAKDQAIIRMRDANYLNEDIDMIAKVSVASSAVPFIVPPVEINKHSHCDGGVGYASPLGSLMPAFKAEQLSYHIVYISPVRYSSKQDPSVEAEQEDDDVWNKIKSSSTGLVTGLHLPDRNNGVRAVGPNAIKVVGEGQRALMKALAVQKRAARSFIEIAPINAVHLNFLDIKPGDTTKAVSTAYNRGFIVRHWYTMDS